MKRVFALPGIRNAYAWSGDTHCGIVTSALELMEKEKKQRQATFYKEHRDKLLEGCVAPDRDGDMDKGAGLHYYSCQNSKGKELPEYKGWYSNRLGELLPSSRTLFRANYTSALSFYKSGRIDKAMVYLGRALHFVGDMGCTPHVSNVKLQEKNDNLHYAFERSINNIYGKHKAVSFDKRLSKLYEKCDPGEAFNRLAVFAGKFLDTISHLDPRAFDDTAENTLPMTQQHTMAVLMRFYDERQSDMGNYVVDGKQYTFRNEATGLVLTVGAKAPSLEKPDKESEQKLTVRLSDNGTIGLITAAGTGVSSSLKGYDHIKMDGEPSQFRLEALGKRRFIITTEDSGYTKVLCNSKGGRLGVTDFEPDDPLQVWVIN